MQVVTLASARVEAETAEQWFEEGCELEQDPDGMDQAIAAYRKALDIEPNFTDAIINLAGILVE